MRDYAEVRGERRRHRRRRPTPRSTLLEVDELGLDRLDREILRAICAKFDGGPVGLSTLAVAVGEEQDTIEDVYEPYLLQSGLLKRTPAGASPPPRAFAHLGLEPARPPLFDDAGWWSARRTARARRAGDDVSPVRDERLVMGRWSGALRLLAGLSAPPARRRPGSRMTARGWRGRSPPSGSSTASPA